MAADRVMFGLSVGGLEKVADFMVVCGSFFLLFFNTFGLKR